MHQKLQTAYTEFRKAGYRPVESLANARILLEWKGYENEYDDFVRIIVESERESYFAVYGEPEGYADRFGRYHSPEQAKQEIIDQIELNGCWHVISEVNVSDDTENPEWEMVDSIGMCVGYDDATSPFENCYVIDLMNAANKRAREIIIDSLYADLLEV